MAKSKSFFGLRKGSTKTMTYSVLRGQQITKDRVTDIANPRTMDQTLQRIPFAQAVKFYKQATNGLFRFAFEDKRPLESDYNAFMRHNVKYASSVSLDNYRNRNYPAIGNWILASGSLVSPIVTTAETFVKLAISVPHTGADTVGEITPIILAAYPTLGEGDIVTFVVFQSNVLSGGALSSQSEPIMYMTQFVLDSASEVTLDELGFDAFESSSSSLNWDNASGLYAFGGAVIFSRNTPSGLKVSESHLVGNTIWNAVMDNSLNVNVRQGNAFSWGAMDKAILQGSISD